MSSKRKHGMILYMTIEEFFTGYVKTNNLNRTQIIIVSRDVTADIKTNEKYNNITYSSKYDNIDFVPSLLPPPSSMEFAYGDDKSRFMEAYEGHLLSDETFTDIICIADMVVNDGVDVIMLSSKAEFASQFPYFLKDFVHDKIGLKICLSEQLSGAESDEEYEKLITDIGDIDDIKTLIDYNKKELSEDHTSEEEFFNRFMEDAPIKYKKVLMTKDIDYILSLGRDKGLRLNKRKSKEELVNAIVVDVFGEGVL